MKRQEPAASYRMIKDDLMPFSMSFNETCKIMDSNEWQCPYCGKSKCWSGVTLPKEESELLLVCPVSVYVADLAHMWAIEPDAAAKILVSMSLLDELGVRPLTQIDIAGMLSKNVAKIHSKGKKKPDAEQSTANLWYVEFPRKPAVLKQKKPKVKPVPKA